MGETPLPLPEQPELRVLAQALEEAGAAAEILDHKWRVVYTTSQDAVALGLAPSEMHHHYGLSVITRPDRRPEWVTDRETGSRFWRAVGPHILRDVPPDDPEFAEVFGQQAPRARDLTPAPPTLAHRVEMDFETLASYGKSSSSTAHLVHIRLHDVSGRFIGTLMLALSNLPQSLALRLGRGDIEMYRRMDRLREPCRRAAAILFADLEASGELSRRLSSRAYFDLIRALTDLIDSVVGAHTGILGKHAGDGASALFLTEDAGDDSAAARNAIAAAREIRYRATALRDGVHIKVGVHWGATLMVGQVSTHGRLEVTALGDEMNEAARIENAAQGGIVLASKDAMERLSTQDAHSLGVDPDTLTYRTIAELTTNEKSVRDAGPIAVAEL
ncbi:MULTISPECIES: adenylate/guanylate cyclase domain-containing protein [unclassified Mycolicibacterium]|uniref:adenylate/guanylate cyclase domain-containing protein n=1 Tax=unclassified Mycolicibacterium TaxID=2636767 RepID=UPI002ED8D85B